MLPIKISVSLFLLMLSALFLDVAAQEGPAVPADDFDRGTPLRSANGFQDAVDEGNYGTAAEYLDLRNLRGTASDMTGEQLARRLFVIIKRATWIDIDELVDDPAGRSNDNLPDYRDSIGVVLDEGKETRLLMQKVPRGDGVFIWKVSNATVSLIPELYDIYGYPEAVEKLRRNVPNVTILGFELFKLLIVIASAIFAYTVVFTIALATRRMLGDPDTPSRRRVFRYLVIPVGVWAVIIAANAVATSLGRGVTAEAWQRVTPIPILVTVWVMFGGINLLRDIYSNRLQQRERPGAAVLLRPVGNAIKLLIGAGATLFYLDQLGINITAMIAGLGVGGIAVALALQKPMEDVFGAITLYTQQPVRVGDFCRIGNTIGTIEEIGLRTTRVRTLADTVIAVPNARLASEPIDNISARDKVLYNPILRLRYDTTPEQLRQILDGIWDLFATHERVLEDGHRVRFNEIADDALLVEAYAYIDTINWDEYLRLAEELNIQILEIVAQAGTSLSLPARSLHIEQSADDGSPLRP